MLQLRNPVGFELNLVPFSCVPFVVPLFFRRNRSNSGRHPSRKCESQRRLGIVMGEGSSLLDRSDQCILGADMCSSVD